MSSHVADFMVETAKVATSLNRADVDRMVDSLCRLRGRLWIAGLGGSSANSAHAAADFRRLCGIDARCLTDSVPELTARANDDGWHTVFSGQLASWGESKDALMILSVGGGTLKVSRPIVEAIDMAKALSMPVYGIVGRDGGYTAKHGDCVIIIPTVDDARVTPHTEAWQMVILHLLVSHPNLQKRATLW